MHRIEEFGGDSAAPFPGPPSRRKLATTYAVGREMMQAVEELGARSFIWRDFGGVAHACRTVDVNDAFLLILTFCDRFVPPNAHFAHDAHASVTCTDCASKHEH